ncbi:MAG: mechanosensitive ion channel family protein [Wenzhouxiangellaceae bacterium]
MRWMLESRGWALLLSLVLLLASAGLWAQSDEEALQSPIHAGSTQPDDELIAQRIADIFAQIPALDRVTVSVEAGVVILTGTTTDLAAAQRAEQLVGRVDGVVTIENSIDRDVSLDSQLTPALEESRALVDDVIALLPLIVLALTIFTLVVLLGVFLGRRTAFWQRITPNAFITELAATTVRVLFIIIALVLALNLLGATALLSAVLGSAGVIGLAVGFAVRDTIENYIASIMLSLRQPFRPKDHVLINNNEGRVIRLTSRATILMTLDGNHLRIPNSEVFKATILNYTTNPERRFDFALGVDAEDDPLAAIQTGLTALRQLEFVLAEPEPWGIIREVGDSNIVIVYAAWVNQRDADWAKSRSIAVATVKNALEEAGFGLPEPIYRLRFDGAAILPSGQASVTDIAGEEKTTTAAPTKPAGAAAMDVAPDHHIDQKVEEERQDAGEKDLLSDRAPVE